MPELRRDPIDGRWVIIATDRAIRPSDFAHPVAKPRTGLCPFCPGQEDKTPREVYVQGRPPSMDPNGPGWTHAKVKRMAKKRRNVLRNRKNHRG